MLYLIEIGVKASLSRITPVAAILLVVGCFCRAHFDFFGRCENAAICINARRHATSDQLCLLACVVALWWYILSLLLCAGLIAPCCAVLEVDARRQHAHTH